MGAFHAYDIRGIYNVDFDKDTVYKVGYFLPELLGVDKVLIGRDARESSPEAHGYLVRGIQDAGADVYDLGLSTTPMVYFATATLGFKASAQITASHNPREYNGIKVSRENALPVGYDTGLSTIEKWIKESRPTPMASIRGVYHEIDVKTDYLKFLSRYKSDISGLNITMDLSNGMAALLIKDILGDAPHYIFDELDGTFPNHEANPLIPANTEALREAVRKNRSDLGVIYDGDADRVAFVDENSRFISPDLIIALMGHYFLEGVGSSPRAMELRRRKDCASAMITVIQDIRSSKAVGEYLSPLGGKMHTWRVGRAFAAPELRRVDGLFGGELAGHYYFKDFFYSDSGILASLIVLDIVAHFKAHGVSLSQLISKIETYHNSGEINFKLESKKEAMDALKDYFSSVEAPTALMDFDGYRLEFPSWWFNVRPSNTEPYLRFIAEANSAELLEEKVAQAREIINRFS